MTPETMRGSDERLDAVVARSCLGVLAAPARHSLLATSSLLDVPAGSVLYRDEERARTALVVSGLVRVYLTAADGRQVTVRYARASDSLGIPMAVGGPVAVSAQAITDAQLLVLGSDRIRSLAAADPQLAWALAEEVARLLSGVLEAFAGTAFGTVRQRLARHLLDLAAERQHDAALLAPVTHQALADAVGTAREVVVRTLRDFRGAGLVRPTREGIAILAPGRLHDVELTNEL